MRPLPRVAAIIPARGGSTRLPNKNLCRVGGVTLVERAIHSAECIDLVCVSTDCDRIAELSIRAGATAVERPPHLCTATATTESAIEHWWRMMPSSLRPDIVVLLQPTSPLRTATHVREAVELLVSTCASSVVSVSVEPRHHFAGRLYPREDGRDFRPYRPWDWRPRTQDVHALGVENGAIWAFTREHWEAAGRRDGGTRCVAYEMHPFDSVDIDTHEDLLLAEACLAVRGGRVDGGCK